MSIDLTKGNGINITKAVPSLKKVRVGLGWTVPTGSPTVDIDVVAFGCDLKTGTPKLVSDDYCVFYNNLKTVDGSITHTGDNRTGAGDGDDETIIVNLGSVNSEVAEISFVVVVYNNGTNYTFGDVSDAYIRIVDDATNNEIARYTLNDNFGGDMSVQFGSLTRNGTGWEFSAVGNGYPVGLGEIVALYSK